MREQPVVEPVVVIWGILTLAVTLVMRLEIWEVILLMSLLLTHQPLRLLVEVMMKQLSSQNLPQNEKMMPNHEGRIK
jgi:hypothetical protein